MQKYDIGGMSCAACSARVEKAVSSLDSVTSCSVSLLTNSMGVEGSASPEEIISAVERAGYTASVSGKSEKKTKGGDSLKDTESPKLLRRLIASAVFLLILMYFSMGHMMLGFPLPEFFEGNHIAVALVQMLLSAIVMVINQKFFISGFRGLIHRAPNMDTLVALGSGVSFGYSTVNLFLMTEAAAKGDMILVENYMGELYFESAAMILTLITVGKLLEAISKGRTTNALKSLMKLSPQTAVIIRNGAEIEVPVEQVKKRDVFIVRPGGSIPVDGEVIQGESAVDESALTGESIPVDKTAGDFVSAGTVNRSGFLRCEASRVGEDTTLAQIIRTVSDAAATKAPIAKIADKVSGVFVPVVISIAVVTIAVWLLLGQSAGFALARGISVLVISCPCALGLATPVAIMVGSGTGARNGILFKTAVSLEQTGKIKTVVLDKTGTVTSGVPVVTDVTAVSVQKEDLLRYADSLECLSEHPLAKAVTVYAKENNTKPYEIEGFSAVSGSGLKASLGGSELRGGNLSYISEVCDVSDEIRAKAEELAESGKTPLYFSLGNKLLGIIAVADAIKPDSADAVAQLKKLGMRVVMLTGDNEKTASAVAKSAGIDEVIAGVLPDGKKGVVEKLQKDGRVAMVGDGINDAPALTAADVGIAIGAGTDIAIDSADVVLMKSSLSDVAAAIRLGKAVLRNIYENLFWAFIYNIIGIPLAAGVFISALGWQMNPMFGAAAMSLSSFCVVSNALRLNLVRLYPSKKSPKPVNNSEGADENIKTEQITEKENKAMTTTLNVEGMMCPHCEARVKNALEALPGVTSAEVSHEKGTAEVTTSAEIPFDTLKEAVEAQGYKVL